MNAPDEITPLACAYLRVIFWGIPIMMTYNMASSILRALGDSKTPLYAMIAASITNIALDLLFVLVFEMGVRGAAVATVLAQVLASVYCIHAIRKIELLKTQPGDYRLDRQVCRRLQIPFCFLP